VSWSEPNVFGTRKNSKNKKRKTPTAVFNYSRAAVAHSLAAVAHSLVKKTLSEIRRWPSTSRNNPARFAVFSSEISITGEAT
jgi:hypothetical protein